MLKAVKNDLDDPFLKALTECVAFCIVRDDEYAWKSWRQNLLSLHLGQNRA